MSTKNEVRAVLENFVDDLGKCVGAHRLEVLLEGSDILKGSEVGSMPEPWTRKHLIRKLLSIAGLEWEDEIYGKGERYPDFGIKNLEVQVIGEEKSINKIAEAENEIKNYLNNKAASGEAEYGIATDGIQWVVYRIELGGDYLDYSKVAHIDLRDAIQQIARNKKYIAQNSLLSVDIDKKSDQFLKVFSLDNFNNLIMKEAPKDIRNRKKKGIQAFYNLYVELLFGEGKRHYNYNTTLLNDVQAPYGTTETEKRKFSIKLVNHILFIRFLEERGVLSSNFLIDRLDEYQKAKSEIGGIAGGLYKSLLEPLFFNLFNTSHGNRLLKHTGGWFDKIPYLNGSLFAPEEGEKEYDVEDRMLICVVKDLIEGHSLEKDDKEGFFDPSLLGNVFEMTINHISSEKNAQKKEGAYYTPTDVIKIVTSETVTRKIYDVLVDVFSKKLSSSSKELIEEIARSIIMKYNLPMMLRKIETREGLFGDPNTVTDAYNSLGKLKVVDPACGSGHFLSAVLDEIHRVRLSLLRGLKGVGNLTPQDIYRSKKELVLNSIYGVDINPIAVEIAKLRIWLKMVEDGWKEDYGQLPNININIVDGNSLIGLPVISGGQVMLKKFQTDLTEIQAVREKYKKGEINRNELSKAIASLRNQLADNFIDSSSHYFKDKINDEKLLKKLFDSIESIYPTVREIKAEKNDGKEFSQNEQLNLRKIGFTCYGKHAILKGPKLNKKEEDLEQLLSKSTNLILDRTLTTFDIERLSEVGEISYKPFHWLIEFPEVADENGKEVMRFDIVVGNPPYGDVMTPIEKNFVQGYSTASINDIAAQFVERELQLLGENGYFGNVITLRFIFESDASVVREQLSRKLKNLKVACFTTRPSKVFDSSDPRVAIITGRKSRSHDHEAGFRTSRFIRFNEDDRERKLKKISYESTSGLILGKKIGSGEDFSLPKIGDKTLKGILEKLKLASNITFQQIFSKSKKKKANYVIWRKRGPQYWINPFLENLYGEGNEPSDFDPMYFDSMLKANVAFLIMQSSLFYMLWMVYGDQRHLNWSLINAFPYPNDESLKANCEKINSLTGKIWAGMKERFDSTAGRTGEIQGMVELKPLIDEVDELFGPMFGLSRDEIDYIKNYDIEYR